MIVNSIELNPYYYDVLYGALLHDIGKFFIRADKTQPSRYSTISTEDIGLSGAHSKWSGEFFHAYLKGKIFETVHDDIIEALILYHHNPNSSNINADIITQSDLIKLARIIQIADHASSGERIKRESDEEYGSTRTDVMRSIFSSVKLEKEIFGETYYSLQPLTSGNEFRNALFPKESKQEAYGKYASDTQPLYRTLFSQFTNELKEIINNNKKITFTTLYNLLLKYTINIPSATFVDIPDISLFDHLKTTVCIAACLFLDLMTDTGNLLENVKEETILDHKKKRYLILEGNISGIQNFIYSISSKGAAKGLKGRSFFVQYLGELISRYIINNFRLPMSCEIYCDGGNFYLIIPACYEEELTKLTLYIKEKLLRIFNGELFIDIRWINFNRYNLSINPKNDFPFKELWKKINALIGKEKFQRFNDIIKQSDGYNKIFSPIGVGGLENRVCSICKQEKRVIKEEQKCLLCRSFEELTRIIRNTKFIVISTLKSINTDINYEIENIYDFSNIFQSNFDLIENKTDLERFIQNIKENHQLYSKIDIFLINDTDIVKISQLIKSIEINDLELNIGFNFVNNAIPLDNGFVKDFDKIAADNRALGDNKIGLLRMDIDNLGRIFSEGLNPSSLSRLSSLSLRLKLFFKYWINEICKGNIIIGDLAKPDYISKIIDIRTEKKDFIKNFVNRIKNNVYLIYASGDDLFLIGQWNDIIILSEIIQEIFTKYTAFNPNLTISAGIIITHPTFPLYQAAALAGNAEERAKSNEDKNSLEVLGEVYYWDEFRELSLIKEKIYDYYKSNKLKKSFYHKLLQFNEDYKEVYRKALKALKTTDKTLVQNRNKINLYYKVDDDIEKTAHEAAYYSKWYWRFVYFIKRTIERHRDIEPQLNELSHEIIINKKIKNLFMPVRWAELLTKEKS